MCANKEKKRIFYALNEFFLFIKQGRRRGGNDLKKGESRRAKK